MPLTAKQLVDAQILCKKIITLTGSMDSAVAWMRRDLKRHALHISQGKTDDISAVKWTKQMEDLWKAIEWLEANPSWDQEVRYDLIGKGDPK